MYINANQLYNFISSIYLRVQGVAYKPLPKNFPKLFPQFQYYRHKPIANILTLQLS